MVLTYGKNRIAVVGPPRVLEMSLRLAPMGQDYDGVYRPVSELAHARRITVAVTGRPAEQEEPSG